MVAGVAPAPAAAKASPMPTISGWTNDLRAVFGHAEMQAALRDLGYLASENGRTIDTRKLKLGEGLPVSALVIGAAPTVKKGAARG